MFTLKISGISGSKNKTKILLFSWKEYKTCNRLCNPWRMNEYHFRGKISPVLQICFSVVQNFGNCASGSKLLLKCRNETGSNWLLQGPGDILFCFKFLQRSLIWKSGNCFLYISFQNVFLQLALYCWKYSIVLAGFKHFFFHTDETIFFTSVHFCFIENGFNWLLLRLESFICVCARESHYHVDFPRVFSYLAKLQMEDRNGNSIRAM